MPFGRTARANVVEDPVASGTIERITLQIEILLARRHPHVPDQHRRPLPLASIYRTMGLPAIGFWTGRCEIEGRPVGRSRSSDRFASNRGLLGPPGSALHLALELRKRVLSGKVLSVRLVLGVHR